MAKKDYPVFQQILADAQAAGNQAAAAAECQAMVVGDADLAGNFVPGGKRYHVADGPCGFAGVRIRPANSAFAKFLVEKQVAFKDSFRGGIYAGSKVFPFTQSITRNEAYANAMANVFRDKLPGINCYVDSRLD